MDSLSCWSCSTPAADHYVFVTVIGFALLISANLVAFVSGVAAAAAVAAAHKADAAGEGAAAQQSGLQKNS